MQQMGLFDDGKGEPLAARLRPRGLDEFVGQKHLLGEGKILRRLIEGDNIGSMIFWGPPGVGKTTLARIIAHRTKARFVDFSAVTSGIKEIKQVMEDADKGRRFGEKTILFVDEIHRFNKAQQDAFLPYVEKGSIILIGATTENPSFEVNGALLSRCKVFVLQALSEEDILQLLQRAVTDPRGFGDMKVDISQDCLKMIAVFANGDARSALSTLEMAVLNGDEKRRDRHRGNGGKLYFPQIAFVRQDGRGALQSHIRPAQVHAQFRPRRGCVLAGAYAGSGRRSALYRAQGDKICK